MPSCLYPVLGNLVLQQVGGSCPPEAVGFKMLCLYAHLIHNGQYAFGQSLCTETLTWCLYMSKEKHGWMLEMVV